MKTVILFEKQLQFDSIVKGGALEAQKANEGVTELKDNPFKITHAVAAAGYIFRLPMPDEMDSKYEKWAIQDLPIFSKDNYKKSKVEKTSAAALKRIKIALQDADEVLIATDPDPAGSAIANDVLDNLNYKGKRTRVILRAYEKSEVEKALRERKADTPHQAFSENARTVMDWIVGMNLSRLFTLLHSGKGALSVGRVQTPTLKLVANRNEEIANFIPKIFYNLAITASAKNQNIILRTKTIEIPDLKESRDFAPNDLPLLEIHKNKPLILKATKKPTKSEPPYLFELGSLNKEMGKLKKWSPAKTLEVLQSLYQDGYTTYPRSDCRYLTEAEAQAIPELLSVLAKNGIVEWLPNHLDQMKENLPIRKSTFDSKKVESHSAIITTKKTPELNKLTADQRTLYEVIALRFALNFLPDKLGESISFETTIALNNKEIIIPKGSLSKVTQKGWTEIQKEESEEKESEESDHDNSTFNAIANLIDNNSLESIFSDIKCTEGKTKPPKPYTQATLSEDMEKVAKYVQNPQLREVLIGKEKAGIGTVATRPAIIEGLLERKLLLEEKGILSVSEAGNILLKSLPEELTQPELTATLEIELESIIKAQDPDQEKNKLIKHYENKIAELVNQYRTQIKPTEITTFAEHACPSCKEKKLKRNDLKKDGTPCNPYYYCFNCKNYFNEMDGKPIIQEKKEIVLKQKDEETCPMCKKATLKAVPTKADPNKYVFFCRDNKCASMCFASKDNKTTPDLTTARKKS